MQVLIMRHGEAALDAASDSVRPLTVCGRDESRQMAAWLNTKSVDIERVLVSPYLRAEQTLATVREALTLPASEEVLPELTPGGDASLVGSYLQALAQQGVHAVLIVSTYRWWVTWWRNSVRANARRCSRPRQLPMSIWPPTAATVNLSGR
jgi:phosphohistidine phosphatase